MIKGVLETRFAIGRKPKSEDIKKNDEIMRNSLRYDKSSTDA